MPTTPIKRQLRVETIAAILAMDADIRTEQTARLASSVLSTPSYRQAGSVLLYVKAFAEEIDTSRLLNDALHSGKRLICPRVDRPSGGLVLHEIRDLNVDLHAGTLNIPEPRKDSPVVDPQEIDWVLAPGVAFDRDCNRIGRGAGHYDRLLPRFRDNVEVWAIAFDCQILDALPVEPHDAPLSGVITPTRNWTRGQSTSSHDASGASA